jgi:hypothetical protein
LFTSSGDCIREPAHVLADDLLPLIAETTGRTLLTGIIGEDLLPIRNSDNVDYVENDLADLDFWSRKARKDYDCHRFVNLANAEPFYLKQVYTHKP